MENAWKVRSREKGKRLEEKWERILQVLNIYLLQTLKAHKILRMDFFLSFLAEQLIQPD